MRQMDVLLFSATKVGCEGLTDLKKPRTEQKHLATLKLLQLINIWALGCNCRRLRRVTER